MKKRSNRRNTKQRKLILHAVRQLNCHPTAEQVYDAVRKDLPRTSLSTVYRNLNILVDSGDIIAIRGSGRETHYDHNLKEHHHIKCSVCGRIEDVCTDTIDINGLERNKIKGFTVQEIYLNIVGICNECTEKLKKEELL